jgi:hypothetical protein
MEAGGSKRGHTSRGHGLGEVKAELRARWHGMPDARGDWRFYMYVAAHAYITS